MNKERVEKTRDILLVIILSAIFLYVGAKFLLPVILPFAISFGIAALMRKPSDFIAKKLRINKKIVRPILSVLIMLAAVGVFVFGIVRLASEAWELLRGITESGELEKLLASVKGIFGNWMGKLGLPSDLETGIEEALLGLVSSLVSGAAGIVSSVASAVPKILLFVLVSAISTVYFAIDFEDIERALISVLPKSLKNKTDSFKENTAKMLGKYVKSYFLIMLLTFAMMLFGLTLLGVRYSVLLAFIIALLDLLPVLGIGIVLVPWGALMLLFGKVKLGIGLLILYAIGTVIRQIAEPKIVGKSLGIHPLLTLVFMYVGYSLFGLFGLIFLPLVAVFISGFSKKKIPPISKSESDFSSSETHS
ncbi:MAG: sporulation integral membrane protein YtvI [Clostridia bacterium]|nr:sporulation integral membrane protein YtvI [Clostridia bacterium]